MIALHILQLTADSIAQHVYCGYPRTIYLGGRRSKRKKTGKLRKWGENIYFRFEFELKFGKVWLFSAVGVCTDNGIRCMGKILVVTIFGDFNLKTLFFIFSIKRSRTTKTVTWRDLNSLRPNLNWTFYSEVLYMYVDKIIYVYMSMLIYIISAGPFLERLHIIYFIKVSKKMYFEYSF